MQKARPRLTIARSTSACGEVLSRPFRAANKSDPVLYLLQTKPSTIFPVYRNKAISHASCPTQRPSPVPISALGGSIRSLLDPAAEMRRVKTGIMGFQPVLSISGLSARQRRPPARSVASAAGAPGMALPTHAATAGCAVQGAAVAISDVRLGFWLRAKKDRFRTKTGSLFGKAAAY
jgi:hypothetical protein